MLSKVSSIFKGKTAEDYQKKIDKYKEQLANEALDQGEKDKIDEKLKAAEENMQKATEAEQTKEATKKLEKEAFDKKQNELKAEKAEKAEEDAEKLAAAEEDTARLEEDHKIKVLGGFFVYRAKPSTESKRIGTILSSKIEGTENKFAQQGEITGMVLVKRSGDRTFMTYAPIDPKEYTVDKFMEYFKDTMLNNKYDDNIEKVFEIEALGTLVNKLIVQTVEKEVEKPAIQKPVASVEKVDSTDTNTQSSVPSTEGVRGMSNLFQMFGV